MALRVQAPAYKYNSSMCVSMKGLEMKAFSVPCAGRLMRSTHNVSSCKLALQSEHRCSTAQECQKIEGYGTLFLRSR